MRRPSRTIDDRTEIVVEEYNRRCLARHVRSASAHGNTDVRCFKRRRIVDAVPGHSHDLPVRFECVDDTKLLLRHDPGEYRRRTYADSQLAVGQLLDLCACHEIFGVEACLRAIALAVVG